MAFEMKGSELYGKLKLNRNMDDSSQPDGRAKSSPYQADKTKLVDKLKAAVGAIKENIGEVHGGLQKTRGSYIRRKRELREKRAKK